MARGDRPIANAECEARIERHAVYREVARARMRAIRMDSLLRGGVPSAAAG
ncbi:hypothetical protein BURMUCGD1_6366 [Burkholderia multivorans CGD1]|nr:hypothetical protein BURMUCGD1_6366 [Burkholderia multivorans CGD1]